MSDPRNPRDPALGGDPALDPIPPGRGRRRTASGTAGWLIAILVALVIAAAIWGIGMRGRYGGTDNAGVPVYGGAAPTNAPAPTPAGNASGR